MTRKKIEARRTALAVVAPLRDEELREVSGGRKSGRPQQEFLTYTMTNATVSKVDWSG